MIGLASLNKKAKVEASPKKYFAWLGRIWASPWSLKRAETLLQRSAKCRDQGNSIPEIAGKVKEIKGDKLPKVTNLLVKSLDDQALPALGRVTTRVRVLTTSGISVSLLGQWGDVINKLLRKRKVCFSEKDYKSHIYRPHGLTTPLPLQA